MNVAERGSGKLIEFFVAGIPVTQGSKRAFVNRKTGRAIMVESAGDRLKDWRSSVKLLAQMQEAKLSGAVTIDLTFYFPRPNCHFGTGKNSGVVKASAPRFHTTKPDIDKLTRAILDALTDVVIGDDSNVCRLTAHKNYGATPGCKIVVQKLGQCD